MKNLIEIINEITNDNLDWNYYNNSIKISYDSIMKSPSDFIKQYMQQSGKQIKGKVGTGELDIDKIPKERQKHIVSIFFLGIYIFNHCNHLKTKLKEFINKSSNEISESLSDSYNVKISFNYFWFLVCFYHDLGYEPETNKKIAEYLTRDELNSTITDLFKSDSSAEYPNSDLILNYLHYRNYSDHGIIGGVKYYLDRWKEYKEKYKNKYHVEWDKEIDRDKHDFECPDNPGILWSPEIIEKVHKPVARSIILHNIWFRKSVQKNDDYKNHNLHSLILDSETPAISTDHIFLYFLQLIDTIDPMKMAQKYDLDIDDIRISVDDNVIKITSSNIDDMHWMDLKKYEKNCTTLIEIPPCTDRVTKGASKP